MVQISVNIKAPVKERMDRGRFKGYGFSVKEYPNYVFKVRRKFSKIELKTELETKSNIKISILKSQYEGRIFRNEKATFLDKHIFPYFVEVLEVEKHFSFSDYQILENETNNTNKYICLVFAIVLIMVGISVWSPKYFVREDNK